MRESFSVKEDQQEKIRDQFGMTHLQLVREVSIENERVRLITQLISSDVFKVTPPSLNQKVVRSVV